VAAFKSAPGSPRLGEIDASRPALRETWEKRAKNTPPQSTRGATSIDHHIYFLVRTIFSSPEGVPAEKCLG